MEGLIPLGYEAPDFSSRDQNGKNVILSTLIGKNILLSFHPLAWTSVCQAQVNTIDTHMRLFDKLNTIPFALSVDSYASKKAWSDALGIKKLQFLSDFWPHGSIARQYGVFREQDGISSRANILLNEKHEVIFTKIYGLEETPDLREIIFVLKDYTRTEIPNIEIEIQRCMKDALGRTVCIKDSRAKGIDATN
ncbi:MAG: redoxin domain-containing protein [Aminobacterium sp.]|jgi:peroxiredoxin|uniref:redoxin domain-containing protein n=1 Tax=Aminobacterium sp. MB27-C1 TaxID=3070661 RepID=UPI001BCDD289|nr:redoxin domain-containing protein [Aminobacterium sp. MB27-C1]MDD2206201.1 redoxin domain-containing protein [Aminobacterium sp.]MDD3425821.1 redoxin domain-containing protein [Aminobacterium sp.]MDD3707639.1 redoxin domain-containing protein [Aminobacterium sp.]MDD4227955.1 redoxin domain-containing protein [Aminobacterium sp.]MDD4551198.1 redoxin domain-containing protein [Aminobacterium sp.]